MGYWDSVLVHQLQETDDGRHLFRPWGRRWAYVVPSRGEYERLRRQLKGYYVAFFVAAGLSAFVGWVGLAVVIVVAMFVYAIWAVSLIRRLERIEAPITLGESLAAQARRSSTLELWILEIGSLAVVAFTVVFFGTNPLLAIVIIVFFGLCAFVFARLLVVRRRDRARAGGR